MKEIFDPNTKTDFDWNTESLPDGLYRLRVTATDARGRSKPTGLNCSGATPHSHRARVRCSP